jgi:hypothetical protein
MSMLSLRNSILLWSVEACEMMNDASVSTKGIKCSGSKLSPIISSKKMNKGVIVLFSHCFELLECIKKYQICV